MAATLATDVHLECVSSLREGERCVLGASIDCVGCFRLDVLEELGCDLPVRRPGVKVLRQVYPVEVGETLHVQRAKNCRGLREATNLKRGG